MAKPQQFLYVAAGGKNRAFRTFAMSGAGSAECRARSGAAINPLPGAAQSPHEDPHLLTGPWPQKAPVDRTMRG
jgi:hypothetical protein